MLIKKYRLLKADVSFTCITIDETAKKDIMDLMDWDEEQFRKHTFKEQPEKIYNLTKDGIQALKELGYNCKQLEIKDGKENKS